MAYWGGGSAGGWSGGDWHRGNRRYDGWDSDELGKVYDARLAKRMVPYVKPYRVRVIVAIVSMVIYTVTSYTQPWLMGLAVGEFIENGDSDGLRNISLLLIGFAFISWIAQWIQRQQTSYVGHHILYDLRTGMFEHLQRLSLRFYDREEVGRVMSRVTSDVAVLQELMSTGLVNVLADIFGLVFTMALLFYVDAQLALVTVAVVPFLLGAMWIWQRYAARAFVRVRIAISIVNSSLNENVSGVRVVQSLGREEENLRQFDEVNARHRDINLTAARLQAGVMPMVEVVSTVATVLVLLVIGRRVFNGSLDTATALALATTFTLSIQRFFDPVRAVVLQYTQVQRAMAGAHRVFEVLDTEPDIVDDPDAIELEDVEGRVDFNRVEFEYEEGVPILRDFDLHVEPGETIALVGPTGAGKTTVTALINRSYDIQGGSIEIDGIDLRKIARKSLTRRMSVVLQDPYLFSGTIAGNIRYGRLDAADEDIRRAAEAVGASEFIERMPQGYDTVLHERGQNLSVGQRQLIAFARAIVANPRILILDEATANVDSQTEKTIQRALEVMLRGRTSFVIAHRLSTIRDASRIILVRDGRIAEIGSHEELIALGGAYADLYRMTYRGHERRNGDSGPEDDQPEPSPTGGSGAAAQAGSERGPQPGSAPS